MKYLPKDLLDWDDFIGEVAEVAGCRPTADRGRIIASLRKQKQEFLDFQEEKKVLVTAYRYKRWGDLIRDAKSKVGSTPEVVVPDQYNKVPFGWFGGKGKPSFDACEKRLRKTHNAVRKVLAYALENEPFEGEEWATRFRDDFYKEFVESTDPDEFEKECYRVTYEVREDDPATTWVVVSDTAATALEKASDLPLTAVEELIAYAYEVEVEVTKRELAFIVESEYEALRWFDYLLTAFVMKTNRATREEVEEVKSVKDTAFDLWRCYKTESANDPLRPRMTKRFYDPAVSVKLVEVACREVRRLQTEGTGGSLCDWEEAVVGVVAKNNDGNSLVVAETAEKK